MVFGGTRRRGLNNISMSGDGSLFLSPSTPQPLSECCLFSYNSENAMAAGCSPNKKHRKTNRPFEQAAIPSHSAAVGESVLLSKPAGFVRSAEHDGIAKAAHLICEQYRAGGAKRQPQGEESRRYAMAAGCSPNKTHRKTNRAFDQAAVLSHSVVIGESGLPCKPPNLRRHA